MTKTECVVRSKSSAAVAHDLYCCALRAGEASLTAEQLQKVQGEAALIAEIQSLGGAV